MLLADFDKGGNLAINLFKVYEFTRQSILSFVSDEGTRQSLQDSIDYIGLIVEGWEEVMPSKRG